MKAGVICSGSIVYDTLAHPVDRLAWGTTRVAERLEHAVGGNAANTSQALGILGTPVRILGAVGTDHAARFILAQLTAAGVDTRFLQESARPTAETVALVNSVGERHFLHRLGASEDAFQRAPEFTGEICDGMSHYHFATFFLLPNVRKTGPEMLRRARLAGLTTSLDTGWDPSGEWLAALAPCLEQLDILFMNEDEAFHITGSRDPKEGARIAHSKGVRTAVMKLGARGCAIFTGDDAVWCPAFKVRALDTTGAGDCFVAGFLTAWLGGRSWQATGKFANAVGALSVQKLGASAGLLGRAETEKWMSTADLVQDAHA